MSSKETKMVQSFKQRHNRVLHGSFPNVFTKEAEEDPSTVLNQFYAYQNNKIKLNTQAYYESLLRADLEKL